MDAGLLHVRVTIEQPGSGNVSATGNRTKNWSTLKTVYANISSDKGDLIAYARSLGATVDHIVTIRYLPGVTPKCRVNYNGTIYTILAALDKDNTKRWHTLVCTERVA